MSEKALPKKIRIRKYKVANCYNCEQIKEIIAKDLCKSCYTKRWNKKNLDYHKEKSKEWRKQNPLYEEYNKKWNKQNPHKRYAHSLVQRKALRKKQCEQCNSKEDLQAHHPDYSRPDYVITLCRSCHRSIHKREVIVNAI